MKYQLLINVEAYITASCEIKFTTNVVEFDSNEDVAKAVDHMKKHNERNSNTTYSWLALY